ncbi:hypothetical protein BBO99_00009176 [Phytophthora kernoviae]|uniref:Uncharacterized protein n=2 Tax=Phytophthora kernoviae TaxID=325452 RepID=A0A3R7HRF8_9STRA|nr:hypothetical protein G195_011364 [Phytophthora kernoviae 00238/432]KAG2505199.1 hypothetical protein JM18_009283 [Phytophthora kernoviae]KAG2506936.1 hypothetical protein JM16_009091 [Phytophthora kernoviae]RLN26462.1 hypothetical protein BBI17_009193 [Phytophthora kernoviae]RLN73923.1 hypothetical protein BBO99_00009176 [Phytophthora kernoviae]
MTTNEGLRAKMFNKWDKYKVPLEKIKEKMGSNPDYRVLLHEYEKTRFRLILKKVDDVVKDVNDVAKLADDAAAAA